MAFETRHSGFSQHNLPQVRKNGHFISDTAGVLKIEIEHAVYPIRFQWDCVDHKFRSKQIKQYGLIVDEKDKNTAWIRTRNKNYKFYLELPEEKMYVNWSIYAFPPLTNIMLVDGPSYKCTFIPAEKWEQWNIQDTMKDMKPQDTMADSPEKHGDNWSCLCPCLCPCLCLPRFS